MAKCSHTKQQLVAQCERALAEMSFLVEEARKSGYDTSPEEMEFESLGGLQAVGLGGSRAVVELECGCVAKLESAGELSLEQWRKNSENARENKIYKTAGDKLRGILAPVLAYGETEKGNWLVMPYCELIPEGAAFDMDKNGDINWDKGPAHLQALVAIGDDVLDSNLGFLHGKMVMLDYGKCSADRVLLQNVERGLVEREREL